MLTAKEAKKQRAELERQIAQHHREKARAKLRELREKLHAARERRNEALIEITHRCRADRIAVRERIRAREALAISAIRAKAKAERENAREVCVLRKSEVRGSSRDPIQRADEALKAERKYQADLERIERGNRKRHAEHHRTTKTERRSESDDEVRANISPDLRALFERVKGSIKAGPRQSRTEAFLHYAEAHPREVLEALDDKTDDVIRDLERQQREAGRHARRLAKSTPRRPKYTPEELAAVPF